MDLASATFNNRQHEVARTNESSAVADICCALIFAEQVKLLVNALACRTVNPEAAASWRILMLIAHGLSGFGWRFPRFKIARQRL